MTDTYFDFALSSCKLTDIRSVCVKYQSLQELQKSIEQIWNSYNNIIKDSMLISSLQDIFCGENLFRVCSIGGDSKIIYDRCFLSINRFIKNYSNRESINYDSLFDALVEVCWLLASTYYSEHNGYKRVTLLSNRGEICKAFRLYANGIYKSAINEHNNSVYIEDAICAKKAKSFFSREYKVNYLASEDYINAGLDISQLEREKSRLTFLCKRHLSIYYGLTITGALAVNIRRGYVNEI